MNPKRFHFASRVLKMLTSAACCWLLSAGVAQAVPDLKITKTTSSSFAQGGTASYTLTVTNSGTTATTAVFTVTDTMPTGLSIALPVTAAGFDASTSTTTQLTASSTSPLAAGATRSITLPVNIAGNAPTSITNTANVNGGGEITTNNNSGSAVVSVTQVAPDLTISKTTTSTFAQGGTATYTITVRNNGNGPTTAVFTVTDTMPTGLSIALPVTAAGFDASTSTTTQLIANSTSPLAAGATRSITLPVNIAGNAPANITNTANVNGGGEITTNNNSGSAVVSVTQVAPDLTISKTTSSTFLRGGTASYTITVRNNGNGPTSAVFTVTDTMPTGLSIALPVVAAGFDASTSTTTQLTANSTSPLAAGATRSITLPVNIAANAPANITNTANVNGGGEITTNNNSASAVVSVTSPVPDLTVSKTTSSSFAQGGTAAYTLTVSNNGTAQTSAGYSITDTLPAGLTITGAPSGSGWSFTGTTATTLVASRTTAIPIGQPAPAVTFNVSIGANAPASITNTAIASGGGETNTSNNSSSVTSPVTAVKPDLTLTKTTGSVFQQGGTAAYTLTVTNTGNAATTGGYEIVDTMPAGLTVTGTPAGSGWDFSQTTASVLSCKRVTGIAAGQSAPPVTVTVAITANAPASITNTASVAGGGEVNTANNTGSVTVTVSPGAPEIAVFGNRVEILSGDTKPEPADDTDFGEVRASGGSVTHSFTIENTGAGSLNISKITVGGLNELDFTIVQEPSAPIAPGDKDSLTIAFDPLATGTREAEISIFSDDADEDTYSFAVAGTGLTDLEAWRLLHFGTSANGGIAADSFDADKDGLVNLVEFAFGQNPRLAASAAVPAPVTGTGNITYSFPQPPLVSGITYRAEWSTTIAGSWTAMPDTGSGSTHVFSVSTAGRARVFTRIAVTAP